jgi:copper oxidase (laccase) domain-containing protein
VKRVAGEVVQTMTRRFGCRPEDIRVSMGPGVRPGCFTVLEEEGHMFSAIHPGCLLGADFQSDIHRVGAAVKVDADLAQNDTSVVSADPCTRAVEIAEGRDTAKSEDVTQHGILGPKDCPALKEPVLDQLTGHFPVVVMSPDQLKSRERRPSRDQVPRRVHVDLQLANYHVLLQAGVSADHIDVSTSHCTKCNPHLYYSYERDGFPFGNQIGFISMPSL